MHTYVPAVQERLRKVGYPGFRVIEGRQVRFGQEVEVAADTRWTFSNRDNTSGVVLHPSYVVLEQTVYTDFDDFVGHMESVLQIVNEVAGVEFVERLGFRRVNLVEVTDPGVSLQNLFREGLRGLPPTNLGVESLDAQLEERGATPVGRIIVRLVRPSPENGLPQDLTATILDHRQPAANGDSALLDIDNYMISRKDFVPSELADAFWELHRYSDQAFRAAVTEQALRLWGAEKTA